MADQPGGKANMEGLATEQSSQRAQSIFNNTSSSTAMSGWKNNLMKFLGSKSPTPASPAAARPAVAPGQTSKTLFGAADPNVPGGPKEVQTVSQQIAQQPVTQPAVRQPIANPAGAQHNPPKEASMKKELNPRIEQVLTLLKFAACMKKVMKQKKMKKYGAEDPTTSAAAPLTAAGIGAGSGLGMAMGVRRAPAALQELIVRKPELGARLLELLEKVPESARSVERMIQGAGPWKAHGVPAAIGAAALGGPAWMGARAAKHKGGAGRGAAAGTGVGAGIGALAGLGGAIASRGKSGFGAAAKHILPRAIGAGAGVGAITGAIGGGVQKRRRTKSQEGTKAKGKEKEKKSDKAEKEAALRKVAMPSLGKILGYGALGLGALATVPPALRGASHHLGMFLDPTYAEGWRNQRMMTDMQRQMMMMQLMRAYNPYFGGMGGVPPVMDPEDRAMMSHANYLRGLRSRARTMQEAFGD
jgi:hypothetical protein